MIDFTHISGDIHAGSDAPENYHQIQQKRGLSLTFLSFRHSNARTRTTLSSVSTGSEGGWGGL